MRTKSLVVFRAKSIRVEEKEMEHALAPVLETIWEPSVVTEEQIQALETHGLLRPEVEVSRRPAMGEVFPTERTGEIVVFLAHIERGFVVRAPTLRPSTSRRRMTTRGRLTWRRSGRLRCLARPSRRRSTQGQAQKFQATQGRRRGRRRPHLSPSSLD
jgi:hypothetical protein